MCVSRIREILANAMAQKLLAADEPAAATTYNESGSSPLLLVADHAGNIMPRSLGRLGIETAECERHIAWDIGVAGVGRLLADALDATLIQQNYSRLVIDCNRPPEVATSIPEISELTPIPGNVGLSEAGRASRVREIFTPYHERIGAELDRRKQAGRATVLLALHSFTPVFKGVARPWHAGVMYNRDPRFARQLLAVLQKEPGLVVGDKEPYLVGDTSDYTIPVHGERRHLPHVLIEIRQDLIADDSGQRDWALILGRLLPIAYSAFAAEERARSADRRE
jgi:predicted N-formylglutamate amidohydrolase